MKDTQTMDIERQWVVAAQQDPEKFGVIFDAYYDQILRYALRRTSDVCVAEDITAEAFMKASRHLNTFEWRGVPLNAWLYRIVTNEIRMYYRKNKYRPLSLDELYEDSSFEIADQRCIEEEAMEVQDKIERQDMFMAASALLQTLPVIYQEVITLRYVEQKKLREIAQILDKREGTIKSLLSRGQRKLRAALQRNGHTRIITSEETQKTAFNSKGNV